MVLYGIHLESLDVGMVVVVCIDDYCRPWFLGIPLLNPEDIVLEMVGCISGGDIEVAIAEYHEELVALSELAE